MAYRSIRRGDVDIKTNQGISDLLDKVMMGELPDADAMLKLGLNPQQYREIYTKKRRELNTLDGVYRNNISRDAAKSSLGLTDSELDKRLEWYNGYISKAQYPKTYKRALKPDYDLNVQKMISYKGTIRPMTLDVKNKYGGSYKLRVINIYVKPNFTKTVKDKKTGVEKEITRENVRFYEEKVYPVDKKSIAHGKSDEYYYPDKASWSKATTEKPKKAKSTQSEEVKKNDIIQLRKRIKRHLRIKRLKNGRKSSVRCKCKTLKKR